MKVFYTKRVNKWQVSLTHTHTHIAHNAAAATISAMTQLKPLTKKHFH